MDLFQSRMNTRLERVDQFQCKPQPNLEGVLAVLERTLGFAFITPQTVEEGVHIARANAKEGVNVEFTLRNPVAALEALKEVLREKAADPRGDFGNVLVGVGSVSNLTQYDLIRKLALDFIVTPGMTRDMPNIIGLAHDRGVPVIPGAGIEGEGLMVKKLMGEGSLVKAFLAYWKNISELSNGLKAPLPENLRDLFDDNVKIIQYSGAAETDPIRDYATNANVHDHLCRVLETPKGVKAVFAAPLLEGLAFIQRLGDMGLRVAPTGGVKLEKIPELFDLKRADGSRIVVATGMTSALKEGAISPNPVAYREALTPYRIL